jgi:RNA polymerase sigma-70 factor, ECF subfamily
VSDADLVEAARRGDEIAFGELVERYQASVFRAALSVLGSREEAEDAAQDAFLAAYRKLHLFRGESSFKTWLLAIAWRHALDRRASVGRRLRTFFSADADGWPDPPEPGMSQEQSLVRSDLHEKLKAVVRTLPARYRDALLLASSGDHTFEEIAAILAVPVGTAKWRVTEARRQVRKKLTALGYVDE